MAFINVLLLWGMALGGVPVIIHLLNKRRFRPVSWAAMEFLLQAIQQNSRRLQLRDLILMLIRTAAVVCLALALARPTIAGKLGFWGGHASTGAVILLDNSYSMGYHTNGRETRFDVAKRLAKTILNQLDKGAWCAFHTFNEDVRSPLGDPSQNLAYIEQELDRSVHLSDAGTNLEKALLRAQNVFSTHPEFKAAAKEVYLITDLQAQSWNPKSVSPAFRRLLDDVSRESSVFLIDAGDSGGENVALVDLLPSDTLVSVEMPVIFSVKIKNYGQASVTGLPVDLFVDSTGGADERAVERAIADVAAGETTVVRLQTRFTSGGDHKVEVRLGSDRLTADDRRFCTVEVIDETRILLVDGRDVRSEDPLSSEAGYLRYALSPKDSENPEKQSVVVTETIPQYRLAEKNFVDYQAVALCNVGRLNRAVAGVLARQVNLGLGLMIFLGDQTDPASYNALLGEGDTKLLPARIEEAWGEVPALGVEKLPPAHSFSGDANKIAHPIMAAFNDEDAKPLLSRLKLYRAYGLKPLPGDDVRTVASYDDGRPAILERKVGLGSVLLFPFPATTAWGNLPTQPTFPILMLRAASRLALGNRPSKNAPVGTPLRGYLPLADQKSSVCITAPSPMGRREMHPEVNSEGQAVFDFAETDRAGFYDVTLDRAGFKTLTYSLNTNADVESDLSAVSPERLKLDFPGFEFANVSKSEDLTNKLTAERRGTEVWPWLLFLVFALLAAESILAHRWAPRT